MYVQYSLGLDCFIAVPSARGSLVLTRDVSESWLIANKECRLDSCEACNNTSQCPTYDFAPTRPPLEGCMLYSGTELPRWISIASLRPKQRRGVYEMHKSPEQYGCAHNWIRNLNEEGIEPHPGPPNPRFLCKNLDGGVKSMADFERFLSTILREHKSAPLGAVLLQEHNLPKNLQTYYMQRAAQRKVLFLAKHAPPRDPRYPNRATKGNGTAIAIPYEAIERLPKEDLTSAVKRVARSLQGDKDGRVTSVQLYLHGRKLRVTSAYAPASPHSQERKTFFLNTLPKYVTSRTVLGLDANCVPDTILDLQRDATSAYDNVGANELAQLVADRELTDIARLQLGTETFFSHRWHTRNGVCLSRIDQIYVPQIDALFWSHEACPDFMDKGLAGYDHTAIQAICGLARGERGKDLQTISEQLLNHADVVTELMESIQARFNPEKMPEDPLRVWIDIKHDHTARLLALSKEKRKRDSERASDLRSKIKDLQAAMTSGQAGEQASSEIMESRSELRKMGVAQRTLNQTIEAVAHSFGQLKDIGSAAMFRRVTPRSSDQWVDTLIQADWTDPSNPTEIELEPEKEASRIADAFRPYYERLYGAKRPDPRALEEALSTLAEPGSRRVLHPTARYSAGPPSQTWRC